MKLHLRVYHKTAWHFEAIERHVDACALRHCYTVGDPVLYLDESGASKGCYIWKWNTHKIVLTEIDAKQAWK
jgi:hypothetical protein